MNKILKSGKYDPAALLDYLTERLKVANDSQLSRALGSTAPVICKIRKKNTPINGDMLLRIYDVTGVGVDEQRSIAGIPKFNEAPDVEFVEEKEEEHV